MSDARGRFGPHQSREGEDAAELRVVNARAYRPGEWFAIFGDHATVVLPPSEKGRVAQLWHLVDDGAGFDEVLDALISDGLRELPGFVLVSESDADTKAVVRGPATARFTTPEGEVELAGAAATTWVEQSLTGVTGLAIDLGDDGEGPDLTVQNGLVRVSRVQEPPRRGARPAPAGPESAEPDTAETPVADRDGLTRAGGGLPDPLAAPGIPGQAPAPDVVARAVARLVFSSGETVEVDRPVLVGRAPQPQRHQASEEPRLVTVPSPQQEISSTHLEVRAGSGADHGSAVVTDLGSTNGTVLVQPGLAPEDLPAGVAVQLLPGAIIDLGDGVTIQVTNP
ncbi:FHA domain-containing protein [Nocardioides sp.]|uniref:FHA domain-containing protein n=1 Tax=Nocardioides sp. TaxID=35761 RepID=UPI002D7E5BF0|nr:FHA domain-containing protein [Nocardioides sp.]HET8961232.1 FHA domain-containing protein [Nocardioides sp.]